MPNLQIVPLTLQSWLHQLELLLLSVPKEIVFAALVLPIVLAAVSRRILVFFGSLLLASLALLLVLEPNSIAVTIAIGTYIGSLIVALSGIQSRRENAALRAELISLRDAVNQLVDAEQRRFLVKLKSGGRTEVAHSVSDPTDPPT